MPYMVHVDVSSSRSELSDKVFERHHKNTNDKIKARPGGLIVECTM